MLSVIYAIPQFYDSLFTFIYNQDVLITFMLAVCHLCSTWVKTKSEREWYNERLKPGVDWITSFLWMEKKKECADKMSGVIKGKCTGYFIYVFIYVFILVSPKLVAITE